MSGYSAYASQGLIKFVKCPKIINCKPFEEYYEIYSELIEKHKDIVVDLLLDLPYEELKKKNKLNLSMDKIEEVQNKAGFFDENLIWADFEKLKEVRFTDFFQAALRQSQLKGEQYESFLRNFENTFFNQLAQSELKGDIPTDS